MKKYEEVGPEKAIELLTKGKSVFVVVEAKAAGFLAEAEDDPQPKYNWARETDEPEEEDEEDQETAPKDPEPKKRTRSAFEWVDPEEQAPEKIPEKKIGTRKDSPDTGKICALYKAGWSVAKIADEVGCAKETVRRTLINAGLWNPRRDKKQ